MNKNLPFTVNISESKIIIKKEYIDLLNFGCDVFLSEDILSKRIFIQPALGPRNCLEVEDDYALITIPKVYRDRFEVGTYEFSFIEHPIFDKYIVIELERRN